MFTNINIKGNNDDQYNYIIEYEKGYLSSSNNLTYLKPDFNLDINKSSLLDNISFWNGDINYLNHQNYWILPNMQNFINSKEGIPTYYKTARIRLYPPAYSIDTYINGVTYALSISTWIHGKHIILGSFIFNRLDAEATQSVKTFMNNRYYEYLEFIIPDPYELAYSDDWKEFRTLCGEIDKTNNTGSVLYFTLHPITPTYFDNKPCYIKLDNYTGGQNSINFLSGTKGNFELLLSSNIDKPLKKTTDYPQFDLKLKFNEFYNRDIEEYMEETYNIKKFKMNYGLVIGNENDLYVILNSGEIKPINEYSFSKQEILKQNFANWDGWTPGISVVGSVDIIDEETEEQVISLLSNSLPLTQNLFKYFVGNKNGKEFKIGRYVINNVNIQDVDMNILNINAINKIENKIVQISKPEDTKTNLIQPVFFRSVESSNIIIHSDVTETICINLDAYKSKVSRFILQIEGINFFESGRNSSGVLFKIVGKKLPNKKTEGTYFILNQDSEAVSNGKYIYE